MPMYAEEVAHLDDPLLINYNHARCALAYNVAEVEFIHANQFVCLTLKEMMVPLFMVAYFVNDFGRRKLLPEYRHEFTEHFQFFGEVSCRRVLLITAQFMAIHDVAIEKYSIRFEFLPVSNRGSQCLDIVVGKMNVGEYEYAPESFNHIRQVLPFTRWRQVVRVG